MKGRLLDPARQVRLRKSKSQKQEKKIAESVGGSVTPGSGNKWYAKGDVSSALWLIENKRTDKDSFILKFDTLRRLIVQATLAGKKPMLQLEMGEHHFVIITLDEAKERGLV